MPYYLPTISTHVSKYVWRAYSELQYPLITFSAIFVIFCYLLTLCYLFNFFCLVKICHLLTLNVIYTPYKCACSTHPTSTILSRFIERTPSAPIHSSLTAGLLWPSCQSDVGDRNVVGSFLQEQAMPYIADHHWLLLILLHYPSKRAYFVSIPLPEDPLNPSLILPLPLAYRPSTPSSHYPSASVSFLSSDFFLFSCIEPCNSTHVSHLVMPLRGNRFSTLTYLSPKPL